MLLLHMKKPADGLMDKRAAYVALSRATDLRKLFMVVAITLADLRHKPKEDIAATLDFLDRLDKATQAAFFDNSSEFTPAWVSAHAGEWADGGNDEEGAGNEGDGDEEGTDDEGDGSGSGQGGDSDSDSALGDGGTPAGGTRPGTGGSGSPGAIKIFLAPNSKNNCFHNAAIASTLAAYDGQPLPSGDSCTPSAKVFFSVIGVVRDHMTNSALPRRVLVSNITIGTFFLLQPTLVTLQFHTPPLLYTSS